MEHNHTKPDEFLLKFSKDTEVKLAYKGEKNGVHRYTMSLIDINSLKNNEKIKLTITMQYSTPTEIEKRLHEMFKTFKKDEPSLNRGSDMEKINN